MFGVELFSMLTSWCEDIYEFSLLTFEYPYNGHFRKDSLFLIGYYNGEWLVEIFFFVIVGEKHYDS